MPIFVGVKSNMMKIWKLLAIAMLPMSVANGYAEDLVILHTNDVHGNVRPMRSKEAGGMLRMQVAIDSIRESEDNVLLVDAGDDVQGFMHYSLFGGRVEYELMNRMGYEIAAIGNHEFDDGLDSLKRNYDILKAQVVCANYDFSETPLAGRIKPFVVKTYGDKKIAVIGVGCDPDNLVVAENYEGMKYRWPVALADSIAGSLKSKGEADYAIVLSHLGYQSIPSLPCDSVMALTTHNIDLIIGGHSHTEINPAKGDHHYVFINLDGEKVLVTQTGVNGVNLGKITIDLDDLDEVPDYELLPIDNRYDNRLDKATEEWLAPFDREVERVMAVEVARSADDMPDDSDELCNWVADVIYAIGSKVHGEPVDLAVTNKGGIRQPLRKGMVSMGEIMTMVPFPNSVLIVELDGKTLQSCLNEIVATGGQAVSRQLSFGAKDGKAVNITINGNPLDPDKLYKVATIDYVYNGGDRLVSFKKGKIVSRSNRFMKYDFVDYLKTLDSPIQADRTKRMYIIEN